MEDLNKDIIGIGWSFPPSFIKNGENGELLMTQGKEDIDRSLEILLNTAFGERVMRPEYGCDLRRFLFDPYSFLLQFHLLLIQYGYYVHLLSELFFCHHHPLRFPFPQVSGARGSFFCH